MAVNNNYCELAAAAEVQRHRRRLSTADARAGRGCLHAHCTGSHYTHETSPRRLHQLILDGLGGSRTAVARADPGAPPPSADQSRKQFLLAAAAAARPISAPDKARRQCVIGSNNSYNRPASPNGDILISVARASRIFNSMLCTVPV